MGFSSRGGSLQSPLFLMDLEVVFLCYPADSAGSFRYEWGISTDKLSPYVLRDFTQLKPREGRSAQLCLSQRLVLSGISSGKERQ